MVPLLLLLILLFLCYRRNRISNGCFLQSLRFDKDVVLAWTNRRDFPKLFRERHLFLPPPLQNDKAVCAEYCRQIPRSLQDCSIELCDDDELVSIAIEKGGGGLELQYASLRLQQTESIVRKACRRNGEALLFCPPISTAFRNIIDDRNFMLNVVLGGGDDDDNDEDLTSQQGEGIDGAGQRRRKRKRGKGRKKKSSSGVGGKKKGSGSMWKLLDPSVRETDEELALSALRNGLALRDVPSQFVNVSFLKRALSNNSVPLYLELSSQYQSIPELALEAVIANDSTPEVHSKAFEYNNIITKGGSNITNDGNNTDSSSLRDNRDVIFAVCRRGSVELLRELLGNPPDELPPVNDPRLVLNQFVQLMEAANAIHNDINNNNPNNNNDNNNGGDNGAAVNNGFNNNNNGNNVANNIVINNNNNNDIAAELNFLAAEVNGNAIINANANVNNNVNANANANNNANADPNDDHNVEDERMGLDVLEDLLHHGQEMDPHLQLQQQLLQPPLLQQPQRPPTSRFLDDYDVMKIAVARDPKLFGNVSNRLKDNIDIILASINDGPSAWIRLKNIPWNVQRQNPIITIKCLRCMDAKNLRYLPNYIPDDVWTANRELRIAWIRRKGNILPCFLPGIMSDETLALEVAKYTWTQLYKVGDGFLSDKRFMLKALEIDGRCIRHVKTTQLRTDFEILTTAVANYYNRYDCEVAAAAAAFAAAKKKKKSNNIATENGGDDEESATANTTAPPTKPTVTIASMAIAFRDFCDIDQLKEIYIQKLKMHQFFLLDFLRGIAISSPSSSTTTTSALPQDGDGRSSGPSALLLRSSTLTMLDRGVETSEAFKRLIAEYLAVPIGKELANTRKAFENINRPSPNDNGRGSNVSDNNNNGRSIKQNRRGSRDRERERDVLGVELPLFNHMHPARRGHLPVGRYMQAPRADVNIDVHERFGPQLIRNQPRAIDRRNVAIDRNNPNNNNNVDEGNNNNNFFAPPVHLAAGPAPVRRPPRLRRRRFLDLFRFGNGGVGDPMFDDDDVEDDDFVI